MDAKYVIRRESELEGILEKWYSEELY